MSKEEFDIDEEIEKMSRRTNINMRKSEYAYENQIKKLEKSIDDIVKDRIKTFDEDKQLTLDYLSIDYTSSTVDNYRKRLKKI